METVKNCIAVINATFKVDDELKHLSFYITKSKHDYDCETEAKCNSVIAVCKMLSAISIVYVRYNTVCNIDPCQYVNGRCTNEGVMKEVYKDITKGNNYNIII